MRVLGFLALLLLVTPVFADLQSNSAISPRYVDTNVINQTFVYTIVPLNGSWINRTIINAPAGYQIVALQDVTLGSNNDSCLATACALREVNSTQIAINFSSIVNSTINNPIIFTFLVNTSSSAVVGNFTSYLNNSAFHNQTTDLGINVTTQQIINVTNVEMVKGTALANGTDYWEFKFWFTYTAPVNGLVQFKMNDWVDAASQRIYINTSSTASYATLRNESTFNTTGKFNVTTNYGSNIGINTSSIPSPYYLWLRMIIPSGVPISNSWSTTYNLLYRASP